MIRWLWLDLLAPECAPAPSHTLNHAVVFFNLFLIRVWGDGVNQVWMWRPLNSLVVHHHSLCCCSANSTVVQEERGMYQVVGQNTEVEIYNFLLLLVFQDGIADQQGYSWKTQNSGRQEVLICRLMWQEGVSFSNPCNPFERGRNFSVINNGLDFI